MTHGSATIDNSDRAEILAFDYEEGNGKVRTYLWGHQFDYVVILEKKIRGGRDTAYLIVTAYCVDGASTRRRLQKKYEHRLA